MSLIPGLFGEESASRAYSEATTQSWTSQDPIQGRRLQKGRLFMDAESSIRLLHM